MRNGQSSSTSRSSTFRNRTLHGPGPGPPAKWLIQTMREPRAGEMSHPCARFRVVGLTYPKDPEHVGGPYHESPAAAEAMLFKEISA